VNGLGKSVRALTDVVDTAGFDLPDAPHAAVVRSAPMTRPTTQRRAVTMLIRVPFAVDGKRLEIRELVGIVAGHSRHSSPTLRTLSG
jgi:hypothetical protein